MGKLRSREEHRLAYSHSLKSARAQVLAWMSVHHPPAALPFLSPPVLTPARKQKEHSV